ncbi:MAG: TM2 domain-containing protein [Cyanobacteria bacterium P01_D01_bin.116]
MKQVNSGIAYLVWCLCFFGVCGGQRFYAGNFAGGVIYLVTFGLFGFGQLIDLALIPGMVEKRNLYLRGLYGGGNSNNANQSVTVNIGEIPEIKQLQELQTQKPSSISSMQKLLNAANKHGGQLSIAQAAMSTELEAEEVKTLLEEAQRIGYAEMTNDLNTGAIRYKFDI